MAKVHKGGRKKKQGPRYKSGDLIPTNDDRGTFEYKLKRDFAAGIRTEQDVALIQSATEKLRHVNLHPSSVGISAIVAGLRDNNVLTDPEIKALKGFNNSVPLSTGIDPLDILLARRIIDRDQFEHALDFAACWCAYIGRPWPKGWQAERQSPDHDGGISESQLKRMKARYWNCYAAMHDTDRSMYPLLCEISIHGKMTGLINDLISFDIVRDTSKDGCLIGRRDGTIPPSVRARISRITGALDIIAETPHNDFTREALAMIERLKKSSNS